jgi:hypothetical protein
VEEQHHTATNHTISSNHGVSTAVSFDSPRKGMPSGLGGKRSGYGGKGKPRELVRERTVYTHFTNATDTNQLRVVIVAVCEYVFFSSAYFFFPLLIVLVSFSIILRDNFAHANLL